MEQVRNMFTLIIVLIIIGVIVRYVPVVDLTKDIFEKRETIQWTTNMSVTGPAQDSPADKTPIIIDRGNTKYTITPKADYTIEAYVAGKQKYTDKWSWLSPYDLALAWGYPADPEYRDQISYSQSNRYYMYRYQRSGPIDGPYVRDHTSNNHIIPADETIENTVKAIREGEVVLLKGHLVNVDGRSESGRTSWWHTSLRRTDSGDGSCEVFYVTEVNLSG